MPVKDGSIVERYKTTTQGFKGNRSHYFKGLKSKGSYLKVEKNSATEILNPLQIASTVDILISL